MVYYKTVTVRVVIPNGTAAGTPVKATFIEDPSKGAQDYLVVPITERWLVEDLMVKDAPTIDVMLKFFKNGRKELQKTSPLSTYRIDQPSRDRIAEMYFGPGSSLSAEAIPLAANGTGSDVTVEAFLKIKVYESDEEVIDDLGYLPE